MTDDGDAAKRTMTDAAAFHLNYVPADRVRRYREFLKSVNARGLRAVEELPHRAVRRVLRGPRPRVDHD
jgi:hypothetical protein